MLVELIKSVNFKEVHIENHLMHLTETFTVKMHIYDVTNPQGCEMQTAFGTLKYHI